MCPMSRPREGSSKSDKYLNYHDTSTLPSRPRTLSLYGLTPIVWTVMLMTNVRLRLFSANALLILYKSYTKPISIGGVLTNTVDGYPEYTLITWMI